MKDSQRCNRLLQVRFRTEHTAHTYNGRIFPVVNMMEFIVTRYSITKKEWTHLFVHSLETILKNWYIELEVHRTKSNLEDLARNFKITFSFEYESPLVEITLQSTKYMIFS